MLTRAAEAVPIAQFWHSTKFVSRNLPAAQETHAALEPSGTVPSLHAVHSVALFPVETEPGRVEHSLHAIAAKRSVYAKNLPGMQSLHVLFPAPLVTWPGSQSAHTVNALDEVIFPIPHVLHTTVVVGGVSASRYIPGRQSAHDVSPSPLVNLPSAHVEQALSTRAAEAVPMTQSWHTKFASRNFPAAQETHAALEPSGFLPVTHATQIVALFAVETEPGTSEHSLHTVAVLRSVNAKNLPGMQSLHTLVPAPLVTWPGSQSAHTVSLLDDVIVP